MESEPGRQAMLELRVLDHIPEGFTEAPARALAEILPGPVLFDLPCRRHEPLFASVLLHGNEDTGLLAVQEVLRRYRGQELPRRLLLFVGNVEAAAAGVRTLPTQLDYNRAWPGTLHPDTPEAGLMLKVVDYVARQKPFASIDIHNNTGVNPHYACLNRLEPDYLHLARLFSRTVVFFETPVGVQSSAMAEICPAVTVECGKAGDHTATAHAVEFVEACLALSDFPGHAPVVADFDLLRTFAVVKVPHDNTLSFDGSEADFRFLEDIDHRNFFELEPGSEFGTLGGAQAARLLVEAEADAPTADYFQYGDGKIRLTTRTVPAMLTRDIRAVRLDCLCYLMHRIDFEGKRQD